MNERGCSMWSLSITMTVMVRPTLRMNSGRSPSMELKIAPVKLDSAKPQPFESVPRTPFHLTHAGARRIFTGSRFLS